MHAVILGLVIKLIAFFGSIGRLRGRPLVRRWVDLGEARREDALTRMARGLVQPNCEEWDRTWMIVAREISRNRVSSIGGKKCRKGCTAASLAHGLVRRKKASERKRALGQAVCREGLKRGRGGGGAGFRSLIRRTSRWLPGIG